jgi:hypothetical protein
MVLATQDAKMKSWLQGYRHSPAGGSECKNGLSPEIYLRANQLDIGSGLPESPCNNLRSEGLLS